MRTVDTPGVHTMADLEASLRVALRQTLKTLLVEGAEGGLVALCLRGDHILNAVKAQALDEVAIPLRMASADRVHAVCGCGPGSVGPVGLPVPVIVDAAAAAVADFVCGANAEGKHLTGVNWGRDLPEPRVADLRRAMAGDPSPDGSGPIRIARGIEVGHIFQLGTKYSDALNAVVLDEKGKATPLVMGCYGIGITRVVAAAIEQNHDQAGIIWPIAIAPYQVTVLPMNMHKSVRLREAVETLYGTLQELGLEVLLDDRQVRPGVMFNDADLLGIPHRIVVGDRGLDEGVVEYRRRRDTETESLPMNEAASIIAARIRDELSAQSE